MKSQGKEKIVKLLKFQENGDKKGGSSSSEMEAEAERILNEFSSDSSSSPILKLLDRNSKLKIYKKNNKERLFSSSK